MTKGEFEENPKAGSEACSAPQGAKGRKSLVCNDLRPSWSR
jgi:hypothetical protein